MSQPRRLLLGLGLLLAACSSPEGRCEEGFALDPDGRCVPLEDASIGGDGATDDGAVDDGAIDDGAVDDAALDAELPDGGPVDAGGPDASGDAGVEPTCGDGRVDPGEECDDGNELPNDGCSPTCREPSRDLCERCSSDADCGRSATSVCVSEGPSGYCAIDCAHGCPAGFSCEVYEGASVCRPVDGSCGGCIDEDGDGYGRGASCLGPDCDDTDDRRYPGAPEAVGAAVDASCDGVILCYVDADDDGFRTEATVSSTDADCDDPGEAYATTPSGDCDDTRADVFPGATELPGSGVDESCDGVQRCYLDADRDGHRVADTVDVEGDCSAAGLALATLPADDCDDSDPTVHPGAAEGVGEDKDCDGRTRCYLDADRDGAATDALSAPTSDLTCRSPGLAPSLPAALDCDDADADVFPGAEELCDGRDNDCDGEVDVGVTSRAFWPDADGDGYGDPMGGAVEDCRAPTGYVANDRDCDDSSAAVSPGATETCNERDDDCNGTVDDGYATDARLWYLDGDGDGFGAAIVSVRACTRPTRHVATAGDCNDARADVRPGATEMCDGVDGDCDGRIDEAAADAATWIRDADGDGFGDVARTDEVRSCSAVVGYADNARDCDDTRGTVNPSASETCNARDDDCDTRVDENPSSAPSFWRDADADGFGTSTQIERACTRPTGFVVPGAEDCDDSDDTVHPTADERCDMVDQDCDARVDEAAVDASTFYADRDGDGRGVMSLPVRACTQPAGTSTFGDDCDDAAAQTYPGAPEVCDMADNDCDARVDEDSTDVVWYRDADGDGFGDPGSTRASCTPPMGYVANAGDCDDTQLFAYPGGPEVVADGVDGDCDGYEACVRDDDGDGFRAITHARFPIFFAPAALHAEIREALDRHGFDVTRVTDDPSLFASFFSPGDFASRWIVLWPGSSLPVRDTVLAALADGQRVALEYGGLSTDSELQAALGLTGATLRGEATRVVATGLIAADPLSFPEDAPAVEAFADLPGHELSLGPSLVPLATWGASGPVAIAASRDLDVTVLGAAYSGQLGRDADGDGDSDLSELVFNLVTVADTNPSRRSSNLACEAPEVSGWIPYGDCDDRDPARYPNALDLPGWEASVDENCDDIDGDAARAIFVAWNGFDSNPGTRERPMKTLQAAVDRAAADPTKDHVYAAGMDPFFYYDDALLVVPDGVSVYGAFDSTWFRDPTRPSRLPTARNGASIRVEGVRTPGVLEGFEVRTRVAPPLKVHDVTAAFVIRHNDFEVAAAEPTSSIGPRPQDDAAYGFSGGTTTTRLGGSGGDGGASVVCARGGGGGGAGGSVTLSPEVVGDGANGAPAQGVLGRGGAGGASASTVNATCVAEDGGPGAAGANGTDGVNGSRVPNQARGRLDLTTLTWFAGEGAPGTAGTPGRGGAGGGGGGACRYQTTSGTVLRAGGGGGGGGGAGGCGGEAGSGARGVGGRFGVMLFDAPGVILESNVITVGDAPAGAWGQGGQVGSLGGPGGEGGVGRRASDGTFHRATGGRGGAGGDGGDGGSGGGGSGGGGGMCVGFFLYRSTGAVIGTNDLTLGQAGAGGRGGRHGNGATRAPDGEAGIRATTYVW